MDNTRGIEAQLKRLWVNVKALGEKHGHHTASKELHAGSVLNNDDWLQNTSIMEVLGTIGAGLRLGSMLRRDTYASLKADAALEIG